MPAWEASIDRALAARLTRPLVQPGVIRLALVRRILAGVAALAERLPLLARLGRSRELAATTRIVHAHWVRPLPEDHPTTPPIARPIVHAAPSRTVDRPSNPVVAHAPPELATTLVEGASPVAQAGEVVAAREPRPAAPPSSRDLVRIAEPTVRRSRVGAPLPARPQWAARVEAHRSPPVPLLAVPITRATAIARGGDLGRSIDPPIGKVGPRAAAASPVLRVKPRATAAPIRPAVIADAAGPAKPIVAPFAVPGMSHAGRRLVPIVPVRSADGDLARAGQLPLAHPLPVAHPPPTTPAAVAALPSASAPSSVAAPHPTARTAMPPAPPPKIDVHRLAEQVQHILIRQAAHTRARQGLPR